MPKALHFHLTEEGLREIVEAIKHDKRAEVRQRAMGLRLLHEGKSPKEVAELSGVSQSTVYDWHHRWQREGVEGLANRPKPGRPMKANLNRSVLSKHTIIPMGRTFQANTVSNGTHGGEYF